MEMSQVARKAMERRLASFKEERDGLKRDCDRIKDQVLGPVMGEIEGLSALTLILEDHLGSPDLGCRNERRFAMEGK